MFLIWQVIKWATKLYLRYWVKKNGGRAFYYSTFSGQSAHNQRPVGDIKVEQTGSGNTSRSRGSTEQLGEYVDFEEVK